ncbi:hypothetical protein EA797_06600 [Stutzerimonas zhaodongensis]|uniref:Uncharacterized protein n=1 Tax=Stutzerimonas zhaodongensis TaxID=1176257 RepID=A0A3M2HTL5_9GAMM|nr:hypothetical protein [Stutzerimonas zhaodongensis]MCQ4314881.1 hypothetical protein [Stutzerimonas zhaodongensis]RMH92378.1 hypothetical protein EA797_06600 [Stutzerimonas zhaodongensis]
MSLYEIAFSGELAPGAKLEQVEANLTRLFQADAQRIAALFSGRRIVIKQNLDHTSVEKYRQAMARAGAVAEVRPMPVEVEEIELAPPPAEEPAAAPQTSTSPAPALSTRPSPQPLKVIPRDEYMAAFVDVEAPDFGIAPAGVDLQDARPAAKAPDVDLSQFSLAPVGSDMGERRRASDAPVPDTSHLKLAD